MNVFRLVLHQHWPICYQVAPHPPYFHSSKKHKTMCTLAYLTHLLYAIHENSSHYVNGGYLIKYAKNAEKRQ